jgi:hypothetical protein
MLRKLIVLGFLLALVVGCGSSTPDDTTTQTPPASPAGNQTATQPATTLPPPPPPPPPDESTAVVKNPVAKPLKNPEPQSPTPKPGMTIEKADVGSGDKGRGYEPGIITTPVATYFQARERIMFTIQIPELIRAFEFENDRPPKSHEEFMDKIIKKNGINLLTLPPNHKYLYDPKAKQLMVERPQ